MGANDNFYLSPACPWRQGFGTLPYGAAPDTNPVLWRLDMNITDGEAAAIARLLDEPNTRSLFQPERIPYEEDV